MSSRSGAPREFSVGLVYSLATGLVFAPFDEIHEAIEYVLGAPVWTHHLAMESVWDTVKGHVGAQYPALVGVPLDTRPPREDNEACQAWAERMVTRMTEVMGFRALPVVPLPAGAWEPLSPLDGIPGHVTPIVVRVD